MIEQQARISIFDKAFEKEGIYLVFLKGGRILACKKRSELWKDKTATYWVTFDLYVGSSDMLGEFGVIYLGRSSCETKVDVRYNEISAIIEIHDENK